MKICPWEKVSPELKSLPIATVVWSLELPPDEIIKTGQLCDTAWTEEIKAMFKFIDGDIF